MGYGSRLTGVTEAGGDESGGIGEAAYRAAMRHYAAGVAIITLDAGDGPVGFTATSFASLSLQPPLISFNISHASSSMAALRQVDSVVVHFLGEHQKSLAQRFSRDAQERFASDTRWSRLPTGEPVLVGTPVWLRASVTHRIPFGDHTLVIGLVHHVRDNTATAPIGKPLLYYDAAYHRVVGFE